MSSAYRNNLALHISDATMAGRRRLSRTAAPRWPWLALSVAAFALLAWGLS